MGMFTDMGQDERLDNLERKIRRLEKRLNGGNEMSKIIKDLAGMDCILNADGFYEEKCRVLECDDEWIKLLIYNKKADKTVIIPIDSIEKITME